MNRHVALLMVFFLGFAVPAYSSGLYSGAVQKAVNWLVASQNPDGSWGGSDDVRLPYTAEAVIALRSANVRIPAYYWGIAWLENHNAPTVDYKSRRILALAPHGDNVQDELSFITSSQRTMSPHNSGWGISEYYEGAALDSAIALQAAGSSGALNLQAVLDYLKSSQLSGTDNGWSIAQEQTSDPITTAYVIQALSGYTLIDPTLPSNIASAVTTLMGKVTTTSPPVQQALAALAYQRTGYSSAASNHLSALVSQQHIDGSWSQDIYSTSLAIRSMAAAMGSDLAQLSDKVYIPDANLRAAINKALGKNNMDALTKGELAALTELNAAGMEISDLTGLEWAVNLVSLDLSNNNIVSTTPLNGLTLTRLLLFGNPGYSAIALNLYGSDTQYGYWQDIADDFLTGLGCTGTVQAEDSGRSHGITAGNSCSGAGGNNVILRYTARNSASGIEAIKGINNPDGCTNSRQRQMADETTVSGTTVGGVKCVEITLGVSDVMSENLIQMSSGALHGPNGGGWVDRVYTGLDTTGLAVYQPIVAPFGFFVNNSVTEKRCASGSSLDEPCMSDAECPGSDFGAGCVARPLGNITRQMAVMIYSGQARDWTDFGQNFTPAPIAICMRHAGSGTHTTLDLAVMHGTWGNNVAGYESGLDPVIWFNDSADDLLKCVNQLPGAVGYGAADAVAGTVDYGNVRPVKYNDESPTRSMVRNGRYDFWSVAQVYENPTATGFSATHPLVTQLMNYAADPAHVPAAKAKYWPTYNEMTYMKWNDVIYPGYQGATNPQTP